MVLLVSVEMACYCDDLPAHSHVYNTVIDGRRIMYVPDEFDVRIWVNWKELARCFSLSSSQSH